MAELYSKEIIRHFKHPVGLGRIKNPSSVGEAGNLLCGDVLKCYIKIEKDKKGREIIKDVKMQVFGCVVAIANSSLMTEMVKGKTLEYALKITKDDILKKLGKVPPIKVHCSILAVDALHEAIYNHLVKNKLPISEELQKEHERTQGTLKTIEERHGDYIKLEEKVLGK